ncbi:hypothetical protein [Silvibacterium sp.]|uniref:hypothetical protein n=1 Tax=Silvibacterium sp. TaxID=1964179 RepID=UPI0039E4CBF1
MVRAQIKALEEKIDAIHRESLIRDEAQKSRLELRMDQILHDIGVDKRLARLEARDLQ